MPPFIAIGALGAAVFFGWKRFRCKKHLNHTDMLKNALLTLFLAKLRQHDINHDTMDYQKFDGSQLPMISGASMENACFSYIIDKDEFRKDPWYTPIMEHKLHAIDKYLSKTFANDRDVFAFFAEVLQLIELQEEKRHCDIINAEYEC